MAVKWYMIATSYLQKEACKIAARRVRRKPLRSNSLASMITFRASVAPKDLRLNPLSRAVPRRARRILTAGQLPAGAWFHATEMITLRSPRLRSTKSGGGYSCCDSLREFLKDTASPL
jgi:hypothetical protein